MKKSILPLVLIFVSLGAVVSCDLTESPKSQAGTSLVFGSETGLRSYCYSFYSLLPGGSNAHSQDDDMVDYVAKPSFGLFETGGLTPDSQSSWGWESIRNVNYFLDHNIDPDVPQQVRDNYSGIARFFRAWLYYNKLVDYGEVPWVDHVLNPGDPELTAPRDSRDVIIRNIIADCDFAFEHITADNSKNGMACFVNKWCALLLKSRICLYEASWRKYHAGTAYVSGCEISPEELYTQAADAAAIIMESGAFTLHTSTEYKNGRGSYRDLFSSDSVPTDEVMLAVQNDATLSVGYANYFYNVQPTGHYSLTRPFVNTYLNRDGSFYSETKADGTYKTFFEETSSRDLRLNQTIRAYDYTCKDAKGNYVSTTADYTYSLTGYHITKYTIDDVACNVYGANGNDIPVMRYAEVLLNYAEAKAELGTLTDDDWKNTIGALRRRAGITGGNLDTKPTAVDNYLKNTFYPDITNPVILEIRRERTCELCLEGFRKRDLKRWACGSLWANAQWTGIFIPATDIPLDMNGDGVNDVCFVDKGAPAGAGDIAVSIASPLKYLAVPGGKVLQYALTGRVWDDKMYLEPIATVDITMNQNLLPNNPGY
ncbi:MAG: RagB/SusD family nutrient uptake outer membrane protein [Bacteroidales bacterium]|nr:RagB/SusD family nutrient uptake outer membrane protein [Bacteroidales bacterium]